MLLTDTGVMGGSPLVMEDRISATVYFDSNESLLSCCTELVGLYILVTVTLVIPQFKTTIVCLYLFHFRMCGKILV